jgi:hypothetical protein
VVGGDGGDGGAGFGASAASGTGGAVSASSASVSSSSSPTPAAVSPAESFAELECASLEGATTSAPEESPAPGDNSSPVFPPGVFIASSDELAASASPDCDAVSLASAGGGGTAASAVKLLSLFREEYFDDLLCFGLKV